LRKINAMDSAQSQGLTRRSDYAVRRRCHSGGSGFVRGWRRDARRDFQHVKEHLMMGRTDGTAVFIAAAGGRVVR
jgi:hypothetical protein